MVKLIADVDGMQISRAGNITAGLHWEFTDGSFPDSSWNDSIVLVLGWWLTEVLYCEQQQSASGTLCFMDGPFEIVWTRQGKFVTMQFGRRDTPMNQWRVEHMGIGEMKRQIIDTGLRVIDACEERGWHNSDVRFLREVVRRCDRA